MSIQEILGFEIISYQSVSFSYSFTVLNAIFLMVTLVLTRILIKTSEKYIRRYLEHLNFSIPNQIVIQRFARSLVYILSLILLITSVGLNISTILSYTIIESNQLELTISNIASSIIIISLARFLTWLIILLLGNYYKQEKYDIGTQFAINQILKYVIYTIALLSAIQALGINLTVIWGGAAALLVGFGLGLQQTFNDLVSGIFILLERGVHVGDVVEIDGHIGRVKKVGLRASEVITRDNIVILVPNSKLVTEIVVNWNHNDDDIRLKVSVGVAYGSDTALVKRLLTQIIQEHPNVLKTPAPVIRFTGFGDSSLDFQLLFWTSIAHFQIIEDVKSDLHFAIDQAFRTHDITIPFPQRDVWVKK